MPVPARARVAHRLPGRVRLKIPERRGDAAFFAELGQVLADCPLVEAVRPSPAMASLVVHHRGSDSAVTDFVAASGLLRFEEAGPTPAMDALLAQGGALDKSVRRLTDGTADLSTVAVVSLVIAAGVQVMRGNVLAPAATLLWYAVSIALLGRTARANHERPRA